MIVPVSQSKAKGQRQDERASKSAARTVRSFGSETIVGNRWESLTAAPPWSGQSW